MSESSSKAQKEAELRAALREQELMRKRLESMHAEAEADHFQRRSDLERKEAEMVRAHAQAEAQLARERDIVAERAAEARKAVAQAEAAERSRRAGPRWEAEQASIAQFDMSTAAEQLNNRLNVLEKELATLAFRLDAVVQSSDGSFFLRFSRRDAQWQLECADLGMYTRLAAAAEAAGTSTPAPPDRKWRPVRDVSLVKKAEAIGLVPDLISAMKAEYLFRRDTFNKATAKFDEVFKLIRQERNEATHLRSQRPAGGT